ncbi:Protein F37C4,5 [Ceratobasidium theobromae]|uniref:Protein F37C4,5 n=1 Tax=Ceratobasidium theobromae TaxID=1582974 RepID=A0A5N5Q5N2_9AGAM|nr:Protein F37C4,5 [Ceratobasidium theobromae]
MFAPRQVAVAKRIQELDMQIQQVEEEVRTAREKVFEDDQRDERRAKISVTVLAETDGKAELMLTYVVTDASWRPLYDIRASIPKSTEATSTPLLNSEAACLPSRLGGSGRLL